MKRKNIIKVYLKALALVAAVILLAAVHFIFVGSYQLVSWMIFGVVAISIVILRLEAECYVEFGYHLWDEKNDNES